MGAHSASESMRWLAACSASGLSGFTDGRRPTRPPSLRVTIRGSWVAPGRTTGRSAPSAAATVPAAPGPGGERESEAGGSSTAPARARTPAVSAQALRQERQRAWPRTILGVGPGQAAALVLVELDLVHHRVQVAVAVRRVLLRPGTAASARCEAPYRRANGRQRELPQLAQGVTETLWDGLVPGRAPWRSRRRRRGGRGARPAATRPPRAAAAAAGGAWPATSESRSAARVWPPTLLRLRCRRFSRQSGRAEGSVVQVMMRRYLRSCGLRREVRR